MTSPVVQQPEHRPDGDPCTKCGVRASRHRAPRKRTGRNRTRSPEIKKRRRETDSIVRQIARERRNAEPIVAIDGEGKGRFPHVYTYLSAVDEHGDKRGSIASQEGLATIDCLNFLLNLGVSRVFGFSLGYDFSMMLRDLPDAVLYMLVRPDKRQRQLESGRMVHRPIYWRNFKLTYLKRRLSIQRVEWDAEKKKSKPVGSSVVVWDVFAFYQGKFTKALTDWKTSGAAIIAKIADMKNQRSEFDRMGEAQIQKYCDTECELLGKLVRQLIESHETAGLPLTSFYGAGSTASALLTRMGVKDSIAEPPTEMQDSVSRGFFGGRFELSLVGAVDGPCWNHDLSSAYPYELWRLPCLTHGRWRLVTGPPTDVDRAVRGARLALVHCKVKGGGPRCWGPLPFRIPRAKSIPAELDVTAGSILFPLKSEGCWIWQDEYLAAHDTLWTGVTAIDAWCYQTDCDCRPFAELPEIYKERVRIGKEGPGIVLKLGPNSCLSGDTLVTTDEGTVPISLLTGRSARVLGHGRTYQHATFRSYGRQRLYVVILCDGQVFKATADHRWPYHAPMPISPTSPGLAFTTTLDLVGKHLYRTTNEAPLQVAGVVPTDTIEEVFCGTVPETSTFTIGHDVLTGNCYGKTAQSQGSAPFRSWIYAGCVTSGTRAKILRAIAAAKDPANILMVATDGILAREQLVLDKPEDTGTWELPDEKGNIVKKPLGGWEITGVTDDKKPKPIFLARPGIYWPLHATKEELQTIKARGISRSVLAERAAHIEAHFRRRGWQVPYEVDSRCLPCDVPTPFKVDEHGRKVYKKACPSCDKPPSPPCVRFIGVRQGIDCNAEGRALLKAGKPITGEHVTRRDNFGEWVEWPLKITFAPAPKRVTVRKDMTLECWERYPGESAPYNKAFGGLDALMIQQYQKMIEEQPDGDLQYD